MFEICDRVRCKPEIIHDTSMSIMEHRLLTLATMAGEVRDRDIYGNVLVKFDDGSAYFIKHKYLEYEETSSSYQFNPSDADISLLVGM